MAPFNFNIEDEITDIKLQNKISVTSTLDESDTYTILNVIKDTIAVDDTDLHAVVINDNKICVISNNITKLVKFKITILGCKIDIYVKFHSFDNIKFKGLEKEYNHPRYDYISTRDPLYFICSWLKLIKKTYNNILLNNLYIQSNKYMQLEISQSLFEKYEDCLPNNIFAYSPYNSLDGIDTFDNLHYCVGINNVSFDNNNTFIEQDSPVLYKMVSWLKSKNMSNIIFNFKYHKSDNYDDNIAEICLNYYTNKLLTNVESLLLQYELDKQIQNLPDYWNILSGYINKDDEIIDKAENVTSYSNFKMNIEVILNNKLSKMVKTKLSKFEKVIKNEPKSAKKKVSHTINMLLWQCALLLVYYHSPFDKDYIKYKFTKRQTLIYDFYRYDEIHNPIIIIWIILKEFKWLAEYLNSIGYTENSIFDRLEILYNYILEKGFKNLIKV